MSEAFAAFGQNFRVLFSSLLAFSSSAMVAATLIVIKNDDKLTEVTTCAYIICVLSFAITIAIAIISSYIGLSHEVNEGKATDSLDARAINDKKFKIIELSLIPFFIGFVMFVVVLLSITKTA